MLRKVAISGATSPIGVALTKECLKQNIEVIAIINPDSSKKSRIPVSSSVRIVECPLDGYGNFAKEIKDEQLSADVFIHLAWASTDGDAARNMLTPQALNIQYALDAVELADSLGCTTFIGAGSQAEYGRTNETLKETTECHPETGYGIAKLCAGQLTRLACRQKGIRHIWPRILSTYGPNSNPKTIISYVITELISNRTPSLTACEQIWDFIYVDDAARALISLAESGHDGEIYVIGSGMSAPLSEYMTKIRDAVDINAKLGIGDKPYSDTTVMHLSCSIDKLTKDTGFVPLVAFEDGIKQTIEYIKANN